MKLIPDRYRDRFWVFVALSIFLHGIFFSILIIMPEPEVETNLPIPVRIVSIPSEKKKEKPPKPPEPKEIVSLPKRPRGVEKKPKKSRFFAEKSMTVEKETRVKNTPKPKVQKPQPPDVVVSGGKGTEGGGEAVSVEIKKVPPKKPSPPQQEEVAGLEKKALEDAPPIILKSKKENASQKVSKTEEGAFTPLSKPEQGVSSPPQKITPLPAVKAEKGAVEKPHERALKGGDGGSGKKGRKGLGLKDLFPSKERLSMLEKAYRESLPSDIEEGETVALNTTEFRFASYFSGIKRKIELVWDYPEAAARRGEQGRLKLRFTIKKDGSLEDVTLLKSSGYPILDDEAIRAIKVAAPYNPFPKNLKQERINIVATFEYVIEPRFYRRIR